jgi:hypothetical protein
VQYDFDQPKTVSAVEIYWFDDTGVGQCRVPKSWRLLYLDKGVWNPVPKPTSGGVAKDTWNPMRFQSVTASALRIEADLQPGFSGGILEWRVK